MKDNASTAQYGTWQSPEGQPVIRYLLSLFHEIDFAVNEGYRRIAHGGIEVGGLLFGHETDDEVTIEAFRPIECEHASGPSFVLSDRDLTRLQDQLASTDDDAELVGKVVLGWFVAHTRSDLQMNEREAEWFGSLFPETCRITLLIKPERFKATRFAFLVRDRVTKSYARDGRGNTFVLDLPSRKSSRRANEDSTATGEGERPISLKSRREPLRSVQPELPPATTQSIENGDREGMDPEEPEIDVPPAPPPPERNPFDERQAVPRDWATTLSSDTSLQFITTPSTQDFTPARLDLPLPGRYAPDADNDLHAGSARRKVPVIRKHATVAFIFCLCLIPAVAFGIYFRFLLPPISLNVSFAPGPQPIHQNAVKLTVWWDPAETENSPVATIQVGDDEPIALSASERLAGRTQIFIPTASARIQLSVQHMFYKAKGVTRYVQASRSIVRGHMTTG